MLKPKGLVDVVQVPMNLSFIENHIKVTKISHGTYACFYNNFHRKCGLIAKCAFPLKVGSDY